MKIKNNKDDKEFYNIISPLLNEPLVQKMNEYEHHHFQSRLDHCLSVSYYGFKIGKKLGLNYKSMARAGLLHDMFFYDWRTTKFDEGTHAYVHPRIALQNAKKITKITPLEEDIIVHHMMGSTLDITRSKEAFIVSMIDKYISVSEISRSGFFKFSNRSPYNLQKALLLLK